MTLDKVLITFTFYCSNLWKGKFMPLEKPGKLGEFFSPTLFVATLSKSLVSVLVLCCCSWHSVADLDVVHPVQVLNSKLRRRKLICITSTCYSKLTG